MIATWVTANRRRIPIGAMTTDHIHNCIGAIMDGRIPPRKMLTGFGNAEWLMIFEAELLRRSRHANSTA